MAAASPIPELPPVLCTKQIFQIKGAIRNNIFDIYVLSDTLGIYLLPLKKIYKVVQINKEKSLTCDQRYFVRKFHSVPVLLF